MVEVIRQVFWPEFPYLFRGYHATIPAEVQTEAEVKAAKEKAAADQDRKKQRNLHLVERGGFRG